MPAPNHPCFRTREACGAALLLPGRAESAGEYTFVAAPLAEGGHVVTAIDLEPQDVERRDTISLTRSALWRRDVLTVRKARALSQARYPQLAWNALTLIGHSHGGDVLAILARESPTFAARLITFDNRRAPLPRPRDIPTLSFRSGDAAPDTGVLPPVTLKDGGPRLVYLPQARHDDMMDGGPPSLLRAIADSARAILRLPVPRPQTPN